MECRFCKGKCQKAGKQKNGTPKYYKACQLEVKFGKAVILVAYLQYMPIIE